MHLLGVDEKSQWEYQETFSTLVSQTPRANFAERLEDMHANRTVYTPLFRSIPFHGYFLADSLNGTVLSAGPSDPNCTKGVQWIFDVFADCVDTDWKLAGFWVGFVSLILWFVPLFPQLWENYRLKKCEGLSLFFLLFWIVGDSCNMLGSFLTDQQPIQKIIGVYYLIQDFMILSQYFYYTKIYPVTHNQVRGSPMTGSTLVVPAVVFGMLVGSSLISGLTSMDIALERPSDYTAIAPTGRRLLETREELPWKPIFRGYVDMVGFVIGTIAAMCYFSSRVPQLLKNYYRQSCEGLSLLMFIIIIFANLTYGISVIMGTTGGMYMLRHSPWLAGSLGCCFFDVIMIGQYYYYGRMNREKRELERQALLADGPGESDDDAA